jgi:hypothetical protein
MPRRQRRERGSGIAPPIHNLSARSRWMFKAKPWPTYPQEAAPVPIHYEAWCAPQPVWEGVEKRKSLASTGIRNPDRPALSESLYRLSYLGHSTLIDNKKKYVQGSRRDNCTEFYTEVTWFEYRPRNWVMLQGIRYFSQLLQTKAGASIGEIMVKNEIKLRCKIDWNHTVQKTRGLKHYQIQYPLVI